MERDSREIKQMAREYVKSLGYRHGDVITEGALYHAFKDGFHEAMEFFNTENTGDVSDSPRCESAALHADGGSHAGTVKEAEQESVADQMEVITKAENLFDVSFKWDKIEKYGSSGTLFQKGDLCVRVEQMKGL